MKNWKKIEEEFPCLMKNKHKELSEKFNMKMTECFCENCKLKAFFKKQFLELIKDIVGEVSNKVLYIGEELPETLCADKRPKFVLLGNPDELIKEIKAHLLLEK